MAKANKTLLAAITALSILGIGHTAHAGSFGKKVVGQLKRSVERQIRRNIVSDPPRTIQPHKPCPRPAPAPVYCPPPVCHYFLGVWTTAVEIAPPSHGGNEPQALAAWGVSTPTVRIAPGHGQPTIGLRIDRTVDHSPACRAGLEPHDVLLSANGHSLERKEDLTWAIQQSRGHLRLVVLDGRTGQLATIDVPLDRK